MESSAPRSIDSLTWLIARNCNGGSCVRVATNGDTVFIGGSNLDGPVLSYTREEWITFAEGIRQGDFDDLA
jgi:Domain of unknown function (DUF397)